MAPISLTIDITDGAAHSRATRSPAAKDIAIFLLVVLASYALVAWAVVSWWPRSLFLLPLAAIGFYSFMAMTAVDDPDEAF